MKLLFILFASFIIISLVITSSESGKSHKAVSRNKITSLRHKINTTTTSTTTRRPKIDGVTRKSFLSHNRTERVQQGSTAILECKIKEIVNITVRWYKQGLDEPLTENKTTLSGDKRFLVVNSSDPTDWSLKIRFTNARDKGRYECWAKKIETASIFVNLTLVEATTRIIQGNMNVKSGAPLRLSCVLKHSIEPPAYIFWYKEHRVINYDLVDGTVRQGRQGSELIFPKAKASHSGNYSCVPSNAVQSSITVTVRT